MLDKDSAKLAGMMFLQYGGLGAWVVPLARWLASAAENGGLGFSPGEISGVYSTVALGAMAAPFVTGILADRMFASEKLIAAINGLAALLVLAAGYWCQAHSGPGADGAFAPLFLLLLAYSILVMIGITTGAAMTLRTLADPHRQFGHVRLVGTLGWVVAVAVVGAFLNPLSIEIFYVAAACHGLLAVFGGWLPHTPPLGKGKPLREVVGLPALTLFRDPSFIVFVAVAFTANLMQTFYTVYANLCCSQLGVTKPELLMTSSQFVEMVCMASIPFMIHRFGLKATLCLGLAGWALRCGIFATENLPWIAWLGVPLQGLAYTWFSIVGILYIDREAPSHLRAGAQALMTFISGGPGTLLGNYVCGRVVAAHMSDGRVDWAAVWLVPTIGCTMATLAFLALFHEPKRATIPADADQGLATEATTIDH